MPGVGEPPEASMAGTERVGSEGHSVNICEMSIWKAVPQCEELGQWRGQPRLLPASHPPVKSGSADH